MNVYRSGLRGYDGRPLYDPIRGHTFAQVPPPPGWSNDPESFPETPGLWRCVQCHVIVPTWAIAERFLTRCPAQLAALGT